MGKTKKTKLKQRHRLPPTTAVRVTLQAALSAVRCSESHTAHCHWSEKKKGISSSNSFCGLIFQVLRTQRSSASIDITLSVFKQKEQKVALWRWVFLGRTQPAIHPACTCVQKCPVGPDRRHFVNSTQCAKRFEAVFDTLTLVWTTFWVL